MPHDWWIDEQTETEVVIDSTTLTIVDLDIEIAKATYFHESFTCAECGEHGLHIHSVAAGSPKPVSMWTRKGL